MKHSELPFSSEPDIEAEDEFLYGILSSDGNKYIAAEVTDEDAAFIVKVCNNHYKLLESLKDLMKPVIASQEGYEDWKNRMSKSRAIIEEIEK